MNITQAKARVSVEEIIGAHVELQRRGNVFVGPCPFHQDNGRPNLVVFPKTQTWQCFACGAQGDVIDFLCRTENVSAQEVIAMIGSHAPEQPKRRNPVPRNRIASVEARDEVYRALITQEKLLPHHRTALLKRGFSSEEMAAGEYRSHFPGPAPQGVDLEAVPGFYRTGEAWAVNGPPGLLIPIRDREERIVGCQVRPDNSDRGKYLWLSSTSKTSGTSSGTPCHYAKTSGTQLWITEGPLKADFVANRLGQPCLGVAGVANWKSTLPLLGDVKEVILAFDEDQPGPAREAVEMNTKALIQAIQAREVKTHVAIWDWQKAKGIDDALRNGTFISVA